MYPVKWRELSDTFITGGSKKYLQLRTRVNKSKCNDNMHSMRSSSKYVSRVFPD